MQTLWFAITLVTVLLLVALLAPTWLKKATPALSRRPRLALLLLPGISVGWLLTFLVLGPVFAWLTSGAAWLSEFLPNTATEVCQRCLAAANPFEVSDIALQLPGIFLLLLPVVGLSYVTMMMIIGGLRRLKSSRDVNQLIYSQTSNSTIQDQPVLVWDSDRVFAFAEARLGIVISRGAITQLSAQELTSVIAHEKAHLQQRHHRIGAFTTLLTQPLNKIPLFRAVHDGISHYMEVAADQEAEKVAGKKALMSALLKMGKGAPVLRNAAQSGAVLQMAGSERIQQLVAPTRGTAGSPWLVTIFITVIGLLSMTAAVWFSYGNAVIAGCS